jgi:hypothetical protein
MRKKGNLQEQLKENAYDLTNPTEKRVRGIFGISYRLILEVNCPNLLTPVKSSYLLEVRQVRCGQRLDTFYKDRRTILTRGKHG